MPAPNSHFPIFLCVTHRPVDSICRRISRLCTKSSLQPKRRFLGLFDMQMRQTAFDKLLLHTGFWLSRVNIDHWTRVLFSDLCDEMTRCGSLSITTSDWLEIEPSNVSRASWSNSSILESCLRPCARSSDQQMRRIFFPHSSQKNERESIYVALSISMHCVKNLAASCII